MPAVVRAVTRPASAARPALAMLPRISAHPSSARTRPPCPLPPARASARQTAPPAPTSTTARPAPSAQSAEPTTRTPPPAAPPPAPGSTRGGPPSAAPSKPPAEGAKILFQSFFKSVGPRTYAAQLKEAGNGNHFLVVTEGKRDKKTAEVRKTRLFVFSEDFPAFFKLIRETSAFVDAHPVPAEVRQRQAEFWRNAKRGRRRKPPGQAR